MFSTQNSNQKVPDFFTETGPISTTVTPLKFNSQTYWMSTLARDTDPVNTYQPSCLGPYNDNDDGLLDCGDVEENYDILLTKSGKFITQLYVPSALLSYIIGPKGSKLKSLQRITKTLIKVPRPNEKGDVKISGETERDVASARTQVLMIVMRRKDKLPISHFVSVKIQLENYENFKDSILKYPGKGVTSSLFQKPEKLHLTISTLTLVDDEELIFAKNVLKKCYDDFISNMFPKGNKTRLKVKGLEIMNDDPFEVRVLYGKISFENDGNDKKFQEMADVIADSFYKAGLSRKQYDKVKLHVTLMNTSFRDADEVQVNFDASEILKKYKDFDFGWTEFKDLQLSVRFTTGDDKYYKSALTLQI